MPDSFTSPSTTASTTSTSSAEEKRWEFQKTLHLLLHAHKCQQRDKDASSNGCNVPLCSSMKVNLKHMAECPDTKTCKVPQCSHLRLLIQHWRTCKRECQICGPVRKIFAAGKNLTFQQQQQQMQQQHQQQMQHQQQQNFQNASQSTANFENNTLSQQQSFHSPLSNSLVSTSDFFTSLNNNNATTNGPSKDWQQQVMPSLRNHLVQRLVQTICSNHDVSISNSERMQALIQYARKLEGDMYDSASSKEEYYQLLAEKIYKIQLMFEEKKMKRANRPSAATSVEQTVQNQKGEDCI